MLQVHHMKEEKSDDAQDFQAYRTKETGEVVWIEGMKSFSVSICESYDVEAFPFDIQWLELKGAPAGLHPDLFAAASNMESRWSPFGVAASVPPSSAVEITNAIKIVPMDYPPDPKAWGGGYKAPVLVNELGVSTLPDYNLSRDLPASYKFEEGSSRVESSVSVVLLYDRARACMCSPRRALSPQVSVVLLYDRAYRYHVYNSYGVLCGIGTVCIAIWCLPIMEMGSRLSLDVTLLLVAVAFKQVLSAELPPVSYLTILDYYALTTISFVFVATWLHALVGNLADQGVADETIYLIDQCAVVLYATFFALYNLWHLCYVHTQLFANELMTDKKQLTVHGYLPAQIGTIGVDGNKVASARDGSSIFGKFADRPTTVQPNEVVGVMALLLSGFSRAEAMDKMEAKMAEAKAQMENDAIHVQRSDDDYQTLTEHES